MVFWLTILLIRPQNWQNLANFVQKNHFYELNRLLIRKKFMFFCNHWKYFRVLSVMHNASAIIIFMNRYMFSFADIFYCKNTAPVQLITLFTFSCIFVRVLIIDDVRRLFFDLFEKFAYNFFSLSLTTQEVRKAEY